MNHNTGETLSSRGQGAIRSQLMSTLGVRLSPSTSSSSLDKSTLHAKNLPRRFQSKYYKWEQGFSERSTDDIDKLSISDKSNYKWETETTPSRRSSLNDNMIDVEIAIETLSIE